MVRVNFAKLTDSTSPVKVLIPRCDGPVLCSSQGCKGADQSATFIVYASLREHAYDAIFAFGCTASSLPSSIADNPTTPFFTSVVFDQQAQDFGKHPAASFPFPFPFPLSRGLPFSLSRFPSSL